MTVLKREAESWEDYLARMAEGNDRVIRSLENMVSVHNALSIKDMEPRAVRRSTPNYLGRKAMCRRLS